MGIGDYWSDQTPIAVSKLNQMTIVSGSGAYLATIVPVAVGMVVSCTADGSIFKKNHLYVWDGFNWIDATHIIHTHSDDNTGGSLLTIRKGNTKYFDTHERYIIFPQKVDYIQTIDSGASITDDSTGGEYSIKLDSGTTNGSGATIRLPAMKVDFSKELMLQTKLKLGNITTLATKIGPNMETPTAADNNSVKVGIESCTATLANWLLRSADGSSHTSTDTGVAMSTSQIGFKLMHFPSIPRVDLYIDASTTAVQKTTFVPTTGNALNDNFCKFGIKNSSAASRTLFCYGFRMQGYYTDVWY